ncbi:MAG: hypothetical protein P9F19_08760 [Candidatus Contendobacter sp.]|nr:hypothetical protein [Candidatus Contendobacter sp.]MDG4557464.1 hypothetical protein [Candidatus Contendobacter sp.]
MRARFLSFPILLVALCPLALGWIAQSVQAAEPTVTAAALARVPPALQPWIGWVLREPADWRCPVDYADPKQRRCIWPTALSLNLDARGGDFGQQARTDAEGWLTLPGDRRYWPQEVRLDDQPAPVVERNERPALKVPAGDHRITGRFFWSEPPEAIRVPANAALLDLRLEGKPVPLPQLEEDGVLWLRQRPAAAAPQDRLEIQAFRLLTDGIPFTVTTRLELNVSGQAREETLGPVLLPDFLPLALNSPLPARLEPDGRLRVRLSPGSWTVGLTARHRGPLDALALPAALANWPTQEIWSFQAQTALRVVQVEGAPALDPTQTNLPEDWRPWPAYLLQTGGELHFPTRQRGEVAPVPERLSLERTLWLDFAGNGYTARDRLSGNLNATRIEAAPELRLGRVATNGEDQFITIQPGADATGVEVRQLNHLQLVADSRLEPTVVGDLPAVGWRIAPQSIQTTLNLPPGWRLLAAFGPDSASDAWLYAWNLLDLFLALIVALGFAKLWGWRWGVVALTGMTLTLHEPDAPLYVWLNALAAIALLRVLPPGRLHTLIDVYRRLALLTLLVIGGLFAIQQVRGALYPQLERLASGPSPVGPLVMWANAPLSANLDEASNIPRPRLPASPEPSDKTGRSSKLPQQQYAPDIKVQTGPGLPDWGWQSATLRWSGPVAADERLRLWLLPPWGTRLFLLVGLGLVLAMGARVFRPERRSGKNPAPTRPEEAAPPIASTAAVALAGLLTAFLLAASAPARADFPSPELLRELRARLTEPPDCPRCGDLAALALTVRGDDLRLRLTLHAQTDVAVPLPLPREGLIVRSIELDGQPALLFRDAAQLLWLRLPAGIHEATVVAVAPRTVATLQLPLPMAPGRVELDAEGWRVEGYVEGRADRQLQLTRQRSTAAAPLQAGVMPPFVQVERELTLDVDWRVETKVRRLSQADSAAVVEIPLLAEERITTPGIRVREGRVLLNLPPDQAETGWSAALDRTDALTLRAADSQDFVEVWRLRAGPLWRVQTAGIPPVRRIDAEGQWAPEWRPWPGESVTLNIDRPEGAPGDIVTVDQSHLRLNPGQRRSEATLELTLRASRGAERIITLPPGATLTGARINGISQPLRQRERQVVLPLAPGVQKVALTWREERGIAAYYRTPPVDLGGPSVNARLSVVLPYDRWPLWVGGPPLGPAVLFWGVLMVILGGAVVLARFGGTPLRVHHWFLLGVGLSQSHILATLLVAGWLVLLARRKTLAVGTIGHFRFDLWQLGLAALTLAALTALLGGIEQGLLGTPEMQIVGNGSSAYQLDWYQDRGAGPLPTAWVISAPILLYRGLMLAWSLWLAYALLRWLGWAWECFSAGGLWQPLRRRKGADYAH